MAAILAWLPVWVAELVAALAVGVLKEALARADLKEKVTLEIENQGFRHALEAEKYKVAAMRDPTLQRFGLRHPAPKPKLQAKDAKPHD